MSQPQPGPTGGRTRFHRRRDYLAALVIVVVVAALWVFLWQTSDVHNTTSRTTDVAATAPAAPVRLPNQLHQVWRKPSAATDRPITVGSTVVTGNGNAVTGRDALTGKQRWLYRRDLPLCTVGQQWGKAIAAYRKNGWCGEVTTLDGDTGRRGPQRNGDIQLDTRFLGDGTYVTAAGDTVQLTMDSSLVRTTVYGSQPDVRNPDTQPRTGCTYGSTAVADAQVGVVEHCGPLSNEPDPKHARFTVYSATSTNSEKPNVVSSVRLPGRDARVVAMNGQYAAVALPHPSRLLVLRLRDGSIRDRYPLRILDRDLSGDPPSGVVPVAQGRAGYDWFTGSSVIALSAVDFRPRWSVPGALGPGTDFAGATLLPVRGGIDAVDPATGKVRRHFQVPRRHARAPITMATIGPMVYEQRGDVLAALR